MQEFIKTDLNDEVIRLSRFSFGVNNLTYEAFKQEEGFRQKGLFDVVALRSEGQLLSSCYLWPLEMRLRESVVKMCGLGTLASSAVNRGKGAVKQLLAESLKQMKNEGFIVSALYPFNIGFYRKYGWERFDDIIRYTLSPAIIRKTGQLKDYTVDDTVDPDEETLAFYNRMAQKQYNRVQKSKAHWEVDLSVRFPDDVDKRVVRFRRGGELRGLFLMHMINDDGENILNINNLLFEDEKTLPAILEFIASFSMQFSKVRIDLPADIDLWPYLSDRPEEIKTRQRSMIRIVDIMGLNGLKMASPDTVINVEITDKLAPWNAGKFTLRLGKGILSVERSEHADIKADIAALSGVVSGYTDFKTMINAGLVEVLGDSPFKKDFRPRTTLLEYFF